jgi:phospholipid/cholesterol/gamma-HCH transport system substrate-binding protein
MMKTRSLVTMLAMLVLLAIGLSYILIAVVQIDPFNRPMRITVNAARSGGLLDHSQVSYRGFPVGRVSAIGLRPGGVAITVNVDEGTRIPRDTDVAIADLSAAGEQYLDFRPRSDHGPYLADGAVIDQRDTRTPIPFSQVISNVSTLALQVEPAKVTVVIDELSRAFNGTAPDIQRVLDGGDFLLAGLESVLPQTVNSLHNGRIVLGTVSDLRGDLIQFSHDGRDLTATLKDADPKIRDLLNDAPDTLKLLDDVVEKDGPSVGALLGDLGTTSHVVAMRLPAISQFLPGLVKFGPLVAAIVKDGKIQVLGDVYPRTSCDYGTPRRPPTIGGSPEPRIDRYCGQTGPRLQQRGSTNVPRPDGDHTAGPPPGANPEQRARGPRDSEDN